MIALRLLLIFILSFLAGFLTGCYIYPTKAVNVYRKWAPTKQIWSYQVKDFGGLKPFVQEIATKFNYIPGCDLYLINTEYKPDIIITLWENLDTLNPEVTNVTYKDGYINKCRLNLNAKVLEAAPSGKNRDNYYTNAIAHGIVHCFYGGAHLNGGLMRTRLSTDRIYWKKDPAKDLLRSLYPDE